MCSENSCLYYETTVYIGDIQNGVLTKIGSPYKGRMDYTPEEITKKREELKQAEAAFNTARSNLYPFNERDS